MVSRAYKLRVRRRFRLRQKQVEAFGQQTEAHLERNFFKRLERLHTVRRFVAVWVVLFVLLGSCTIVQIRALSGYYQQLAAQPGGTYTEGIIGSFTNANPIYATSAVDQAVSHLIFAGLYKYDENNQLVGDLADGPAVPSRDGLVYTVHLRPNLHWQDGKPLTVADVLYTYEVIQNPDAQSPLNPSWQGIKVAASDSHTLTFTLPNVLASFPYSLTTGILPKHILSKTAMSEMRSATFNTRTPVGAGAFKWQTVAVTNSSIEHRQQQIVLQPFRQYYAGRPKVNSFVLHTFLSSQDMIKSFQRHELTAMAGLDSVPSQMRNDSTVRSYTFPLAAQVMTFFRTTEGPLGDGQVRAALVKATNTDAIIQNLGYPSNAVNEPFLRNQFPYNPAYAQASFSPIAAQQQLDAAGWRVGKNGVRYKEGRPLLFQLYAENSSEYAQVAKMLQKQWAAVGAKAELTLQNGNDFQSTLASHSYDALLYGISIGSDPDVFAYWDSTQADIRSGNRLNFSEYKSKVADAALEAGRTRLDPALRAIKYRSFLEAWQADAPAVGLYQPRFLYITRSNAGGVHEHRINSATDRYSNVQEWTVRQKLVSQSSKAAQSD